MYSRASVRACIAIAIACDFAAEYHELFQGAVTALKAQGGCQEAVDFSPVAATAKLLYERAFHAERYSGIRDFLEQCKVLPSHYTKQLLS